MLIVISNSNGTHRYADVRRAIRNTVDPEEKAIVLTNNMGDRPLEFYPKDYYFSDQIATHAAPIARNILPYGRQAYRSRFRKTKN